MWYLYSLITWKTLVYISSDWIKKYRIVLPATLAISLLAGFVPIGTMMSVQRTMVFLPFFFLGYYCRQAHVDFGNGKWMCNRLCASLVILATFVFMLLIDKDLGYILYGRTPYGEDWLWPLFLRTVNLVGALVVGWAVVSLVYPIQERWNVIGRKTLFIYIWHSFVIYAIAHVAANAGMPQNVFTAIGELIIVCLTLLLMMRFNIFYTLLNPLSAIWKRMVSA